jgi:hypothetical protein
LVRLLRQRHLEYRELEYRELEYRELEYRELEYRELEYSRGISQGGVMGVEVWSDGEFAWLESSLS